MAFLVFMVADGNPVRAGWLLVGRSTAIDAVASVCGTLWPQRVVRNQPETPGTATKA